MEPRTILDKRHFELTINRLSRELIENHDDFKDSIIIGLQPRGIYLAKKIKEILEEITGNKLIQCGNLDITFYRDDFRRKDYNVIPSVTDIDFIVENKKVILVDDVLYTGRTIRSGLDAMLAFGRPKKVELLVLVERRFSRHLPIQADYIGKSVDTIKEDRVKVEWEEVDGENKVILFRPEK